MNIVLVLAILGVFLLYFIYKFFTQSLADFLNDSVKTLLWLWLPFFSLGHLIKEWREKRGK